MKIYFPYRLYRNVVNVPNQIKWFMQRGRRGWADCDVWCIKGHLSDMMPDMLKKYRDGLMGCPACYFEDGKKNPIQRWEKEIDKMIKGWEMLRDENEFETKIFDKGARGKDFAREMSKYYKEMEKNLDVFTKNILSLWD